MYVRWVRWTIRRVVSRALERGRASSRGRARATASTSFVVARTCNDGAWTSASARASGWETVVCVACVRRRRDVVDDDDDDVRARDAGSRGRVGSVTERP